VGKNEGKEGHGGKNDLEINFWLQDFLHVYQLAKVKYYMNIVKSTNSVIHDVFWAYLRHDSVKDKLCACVFKSRNAVVAEIYDDFIVQQA